MNRLAVAILAPYLGLCMAASAADVVVYDTAWTFTYDGGKTTDGAAIDDNFRDVKILPGGGFVCVGETRDSTFWQNILVLKLSAGGQLRQKKLYGFNHGSGGASVLISRRGDYVVGGWESTAPFLMRIDTALNIKTTAWVYDSVANRLRLRQNATINSMIESSDGHIRVAAGDAFPDNNGQNLDNYAAYLEFDSAGNQTGLNEWKDVTGYELAGWSIAPGETGGLMLGGNQALFFLDTTGNLVAKNQYEFTVPGTGSQVNNVMRVRKMRDGSLMVAGQSYEEDCWTRYGRLYYDAWWSTLSPSGGDGGRNVAGVSGAQDALWDLVQLKDGNIAFAGGKGTDRDSGLWVFVADSTAKHILWEKQYNLPGSDQGFARNNLLPLSMAATEDSGFIVVGTEAARGPNKNAFALRFFQSRTSATIAHQPMRTTRAGAEWAFAFAAQAGPAELSLYDLQGRPLARYRIEVKPGGPAIFKVDPSRFAKGVHPWRFEAAGQIRQGRVLF